MLAEHYRALLDHWRLFDNTGDHPHLVAEEKDHSVAVVDAAGVALIEQIAKIQVMPEIPPKAVEEAVAPVFSAETRAAMRALRRAYARTVLENLGYGLPIIQWREDRGVIAVPAEQLAPLARRILEVNGEPLPEAEERTLLQRVP